MLGTNLNDGIFIKGLIVKTSTIENAGKGLFTQRDIPKGVILGYYKGDRYTEEKYLNSDIIGVYPWYNSYNNVYIDASNIYTSNLLRFVNDYNYNNYNNELNNEFNSEYNNLFVIKKYHVYFITKRYIKAGSELLISYW